MAKTNLTLIECEADLLGVEAQAAIDEMARASKAEIQRLMLSVRRRLALEIAKNKRPLLTQKAV